VTATLTALVSALILSELAFDARDTAYWRRWLGRFSYVWRRLALAAIPAVFALVLRQMVPDTASAPLSQQVLQGLLAGIAAAALLRADPGRVHFRARDISAADPARAASALSWIYDRACRQLDALAERHIVKDLARQKVAGPNHPDELLCTAEEIAGALIQERKSGPSRLRKAAQERLDALREQMDILCDPLATPRERRTAAFALSELIAKEMTKRRWDRPPAFQQLREEAR
jgi:hypothetical protein